MNSIYKKTLLAMVIYLFAYEVNAGSVGGFGGATEVTQILNNTELGAQFGTMVEQYNEMVQQTLNQVEQIRHALNTYETLVQNTKKLTNLEWGAASKDILKLRDLLGELQGIGYSVGSINSLFEKQYPGFSSAFPDNESFSERYAKWNQTTTDTIHSALKVAGMQEEQFDTENETMSKLEDMAKTADGQMKALEVANQIAAQGVRQGQKLRQLIANNIRQQGAYMAQQTQQDAERHKRWQEQIKDDNPTSTGDEQKAKLL